MKFSFLSAHRFSHLSFPTTVLLALLQRTPVLPWINALERIGASSPVASLLRSAFVGVGALSAVHTLAGATELVSSSPSPFPVSVGSPVTVAFSISGTTSGADFWSVEGTPPPGMAFSGLSSETLLLSGTPTTPGTYELTLTANDAIGGSTPGYRYTVVVNGAASVAPGFTSQPGSMVVPFGGAANFLVGVTGTPTPSLQWLRNGQVISGATSATFNKTSISPADAGVYSLRATNSAGEATSDLAILGVQTSELFVGGGFSDPAWRSIPHQNGNVYTQILLTGPAVTVTADTGKVTRVSYIDLQGDIVQLEFSGSGTMTITLENATGPAAPENYNQSIQYMKGHATVVIQGASANTFFSAFSVGSLTSANQALFKPEIAYDAHADLARLVIHSATGSFGGLFMGNVGFNDRSGVTGIYAPGVVVQNNIRLHGIQAFDSARPVLVFGGTANAENGLRILGTDMEQPNGRAIELRGINRVIMSAGTDSHGRLEPAKANKAKYETSGTEVTQLVVVNP
ncbi:MAG TPA: immunoglobulin domain-containing protein [Opitutaceae bacterium]|nr:immunoglobulin domain-containing protein [Opitutaceae bacterium]